MQGKPNVRGPRGPYKRKTVAERFATYLPQDRRDDECWEWEGARDHHGYGRLNSPGRTGPVLKAHRVSHELHHGPVPDGMGVLHRCDNPPCVNPAHLYAGNQADNAADARSRDRLAMEVPAETVRAIRETVAAGTSRVAAARQFGVSRSYVGYVVAGIQRPEAGGPIQQRSIDVR